jgi:RNA methyltransferase, TrmH family
MSPKNIKKLSEKKYREETGLFMVEGEKNIKELLRSDFVVEEILGTRAFIDSIFRLVQEYDERMQSRIELQEVKLAEVEHTGTFVTNASGIAVVQQKKERDILEVFKDAERNIILALDDIRDPGNLGTIIRLADWFGVTHIVASETTTDCYSPKVISATMGSFTRIGVTYTDLPTFLTKAREVNIPIISAEMNGTSVHETKLPEAGILLMGSESHGVSEESCALATDRVTIPRFGNAESLNVGVATGILLDAMRRK